MPNRLVQRRQFLAAACACAVGGWEVSAAAPASAGYEVLSWSQGQAVPEIPALDEAGKAVSLATLRGQVVLLNFWASWCEPCRAEMPALQALGEREKSRLQVLTINLKESPEAIARFVQSSGMTLPVLRDPQGATARAWGIKIYPSTVLLDVAGQPRRVVRGALDWAGADGEALWRPLLATEPRRQPQRAYKR